MEDKKQQNLEKRNDLKLKTDNFGDFFLRNYGTVHKFKQDSGFFAKHYITSRFDEIHDFDDVKDLKKQEISIEDIKSNDTEWLTNSSTKRKIFGYRPFNDSTEFIVKDEKCIRKSERECLGCKNLCKHTLIQIDKLVRKRIRKMLKKKII